MMKIKQEERGKDRRHNMTQQTWEKRIRREEQKRHNMSKRKGEEKN